MKWNIIADSSCDLKQADLSGDELTFTTVPFSIQLGDTAIEDDESLDTLRLLDSMDRSETLGSTACPSVQAWLDRLGTAEQSIILTISEHLSGSFNSACAAKELLLSRLPDRRVSVLHTYSTGPALAMCLRHIAQWIREGHPFDTVTERASQMLLDTKTIFALSSFDNLVKNGRVSKLSGFVAKKLGIWGVGIGKEGVIAMKCKTRGLGGVINAIVEDMQQRGFTGSEVVISHCHNAALAEKLRAKLETLWQNTSITILSTRGLDSFYAERGGLIVAFR